MPEAKAGFMSMMEVSNFVLTLSLELLKIKKEDRPGPDVAAEVV